jgi:hypothetical protein
MGLLDHSVRSLLGAAMQHRNALGAAISNWLKRFGKSAVDELIRGGSRFFA